MELRMRNVELNLILGISLKSRKSVTSVERRVDYYDRRSPRPDGGLEEEAVSSRQQHHSRKHHHIDSALCCAVESSFVEALL
jgi:hypothetical protein